MYGLYGHLLAKGVEVYLNVKSVNHKAIGIYPEIYHGNEMEAETVVRYVLQTPGVMATGGVPGPSTDEIKITSDHIYIFSKLYDTIGVDDNHILFLPIINLHIFKNQKKRRNKTCYLVRTENKHKHPKNSILLTRQFAEDQQALADLLNECHTFYCYDRMTAMMEIARLCGVKVRYYGDFTKEQLKLYEPGMNGVGYEDEEAELDIEAFTEHYRGLIKTFNRKLDIFIDTTQK